MTIYILTYDSYLDCNHYNTHGATTDKAVADAWEARGSQYQAINYEDGEIVGI